MWDTGNGDLGNQGAHQIDVARLALGKDKLPTRVVSVGGRFRWNDVGESPNTHLIFFDYNRGKIGIVSKDTKKLVGGWRPHTV